MTLTSQRRALIIGISGQDGSYLAKSLLDDGYEVHGSSRDREMANQANLHAVGVANDVHLHSIALTDFRSVLQGIAKVEPDEIYNLAAQSSVSLSFETPNETLDSIIVGTVNMLESMRFLKSKARFLNAASSESFGDTFERPAVETDPFMPRSPYGVAKSASYWIARNYREAYGLFASSAILFNHESPLRPARFVTQKVVRGAVAIAAGRADRLDLGNLDISRDWGWAPEYVEGMRKIIAAAEPEDFIIATGKAATLEEFVERAFRRMGLDWRTYVSSDPSFKRPLDLSRSVGNPEKIERLLHWKPEIAMPEIVDRLVDAELERCGLRERFAKRIYSDGAEE